MCFGVLLHLVLSFKTEKLSTPLQNWILCSVENCSPVPKAINFIQWTACKQRLWKCLTVIVEVFMLTSNIKLSFFWRLLKATETHVTKRAIYLTDSYEVFLLQLLALKLEALDLVMHLKVNRHYNLRLHQWIGTNHCAVMFLDT